MASLSSPSTTALPDFGSARQGRTEDSPPMTSTLSWADMVEEDLDNSPPSSPLLTPLVSPVLTPITFSSSSSWADMVEEDLESDCEQLESDVEQLESDDEWEEELRLQTEARTAATRPQHSREYVDEDEPEDQPLDSDASDESIIADNESDFEETTDIEVASYIETWQLKSSNKLDMVDDLSIVNDDGRAHIPFYICNLARTHQGLPAYTRPGRSPLWQCEYSDIPTITITPPASEKPPASSELSLAVVAPMVPHTAQLDNSETVATTTPDLPCAQTVYTESAPIDMEEETVYTENLPLVEEVPAFRGYFFSKVARVLLSAKALTDTTIDLIHRR